MYKLFFLLLLMCSFFAHAQKGVVTSEKLMEMGRMSLEDVSPDGKWVVYSVNRIDVTANKGHAELYLMPATGDSVLQLTKDDASKGNARFTADGKSIAYLADDLLFIMNLDNKQTVQASEISMNGFGFIGNTNSIYYAADVKYFDNVQDLYPDLPLAKARIIDDLMYRHWKSWDDYKRSNIFVAQLKDNVLTGTPINIMKGEPYDSPMMPMGGMEQVAASADGRYIAYTCKKMNGKAYALSTNSDIYLYDLKTGTTSNLSRDNLGYDVQPVFSPDSKMLAWNSMARDGYEADLNRLMVADIATGKVRNVSEGYDNDTGQALWSADSKTVYSVTTDNGQMPIFAFDVAGAIKPKRISISGLNYGTILRAGTQLIAERVSISAPAELYRVNPANGSETRISNVNTKLLDQISMGEVRKRMVKTTDGKDMLVYVVLPPNFDATKKYPALLYCQGGPQSAITQNWSYRWNFQLMAAKGYIVVMPCRRGMQGFGQAWNEQISGDWGGQAMQDLLSAIDDVAKEPFVDKDKLGAVGASFGGYSVYWLAGHHQGRFKAFIAHCGVFNNESMFGTTEEMWFNNWDFKGPYWENANNPTYSDFSPHRFVQNWDTPMLVIHCEKDFRVPIGEGMQAFNAAQLRGVPSRFLYFENEGHWVTQPQNSLLWQREFFRWLDGYLK